MQAGGIFLTIALLAGAAIGVHYGQGSLGIVIGLVAGLVAVALFAWRDERRRANHDRPLRAERDDRERAERDHPLP